MSDEIDNNEDENVVPIKRKSGFQPGQSGNPAGGSKPRLYRDIMGNKFAIEDLYRNEAGRVFYELHRLILDQKTPATAKISAIKEFNDRAMGRPVATTIQRREDFSDTELDLSNVSDDVLREITALSRKKD